jgi:hypothetical protein
VGLGFSKCTGGVRRFCFAGPSYLHLHVTTWHSTMACRTGPGLFRFGRVSKASAMKEVSPLTQGGDIVLRSTAGGCGDTRWPSKMGPMSDGPWCRNLRPDQDPPLTPPLLAAIWQRAWRYRALLSEILRPGGPAARGAARKEETCHACAAEGAQPPSFRRVFARRRRWKALQRREQAKH